MVIHHAKGLAKAGGAACFGLLTGAVMMYSRAAVDRVSKSQPLANFSVADKDGLKVTFHNQAAGESGYWDFGDGSPLEPFEADKPAAHTYPKVGSYTVKLTVRNFLQEEKDRSVTVDLDAGSAPGLLPKVTVEVSPVGNTNTAPATFRVRGTLENVERAFLDVGDKVEVRTEPGPFEQYVVVDKPGRTPIQLIGHSGKQAVKQAAFVDVQPGQAGGLSVTVHVQDSGTRTELVKYDEMVTVAAAKGVKRFDKVVAAKPGVTLTAATVGPAVKGVKGTTATVAADKRSVKLSGEWDGPAAEAMIPLALTGERAVAVREPAQHQAVAFDGATPVTIPLPPRTRGLTNPVRTVKVELNMAGADGRSQPVTASPDLTKPWSVRTRDGKTITAEVVGEQVRVSVGK